MQLRKRELPSKTARLFKGTDPVAVLARALKAPNLPPDGLLIWESRESHRLVAFDLDAPDGSPLPPDYDVAVLFPAWLPIPVAAWRTHGGGVRAIFADAELRARSGELVASLTAMQVASAWYVFAPLHGVGSWRLEVKTDTRHPRSTRPGGGECGPVRWFGRTPCMIKLQPRGAAGVVDASKITDFCAARGIHFGRFATDPCPIPACSVTRRTSGNPPIEVNAEGMRCYRCPRRLSWAQILGDGVDSELVEAARRFVHVEHQVYVLRATRPAAPVAVLRAAWSAALFAEHAEAMAAERAAALDGTDDKRGRNKGEDASIGGRVAAAATGGINMLVRAHEGQWLQPKTLLPRTTIGTRTLTALPWAQRGELVDEAQDVVRLAGFTPVFPVGASTVLPPYFEAPKGTVLARRDAEPHDPPPNLLLRPSGPELERAWLTLERRLPGLRRDYLNALITTGLYAQHGRAQPPFLIVTGKTGAAKTTTIDIAAAALGTRKASVKLDESRVTSRDIGLALEEGAGFILIDEVGRAKDPFQRLDALLKLGARIRYDAKFRNEIERPVNAAIVIAGSSLPFAITRSPELARRALGFRLVEKARGWDRIRVERARDDEELRHALDTVTANVWHTLDAAGPTAHWRDLTLAQGANELADLELDDVSTEARSAIVRETYEYWRTADATAFYRGSGHDVDWLDLSVASRLREVLEEIVEIGDGANTNIQHAQFEDLKKRDLAPDLGFERPILEIVLRRRGSKVLLKFLQRGVLKGKELPRASLPPACPSPSGPLRGIPLTPLRAQLTPYVSTPGNRDQAPVAAANTNAPSTPASKQQPIGIAFQMQHVAPGVDRLERAGIATGATQTLWRAGQPAPAPLSAGDTDRSAIVRDWHGGGRRAWAQAGWEPPNSVWDLSKFERASGERFEPVRSATRRGDDPVEEARALLSVQGKIWPLHRSERAIMDVDRVINERGFAVDRDLARALYDVAETVNAELVRRSGAAHGQLKSKSDFDRALLAAGGPSVPNLQRKALEDALRDERLPHGAARLIEARIGIASSTIARARAVLHHADSDDRVRDTFLYFGAHPGRWSTRGYPAHNQPRVGVRADEVTLAVLGRDIGALIEIAEAEDVSITTLLNGIVRNLIVAPGETSLVIADYRSFEPRTLRWLLDDDIGIADYRTAEPYRMRAKEMFGHDDVTAVAAHEEALAKLGEIACAYRMGPAKLHQRGVDLGIDWSAMPIDAADLVELWRDHNPRIVELWTRLDAALESAANGWKFAARVGRLALSVATGQRALRVRLPVGRSLSYHDVRAIEREGRQAFEATARGPRHVHGGVLTQNITEAVTRDLLADALIRAEKERFRTVLHVHDEMAKEGSADDAKALAELMTTAPPWADGLPLAVKTATRRRYGA